MNNNKNILKIPKEAQQMSVLARIKAEQKKQSGVLYVDLTEISFSLSRDFFFVLSRRFRRDEVVIRVSDPTELAMAQSIGVQGELKGTFAEFDREYDKKNLLAHNMTMWQYFVYELQRGISYIKFLLLEKFLRKKKEKMLHFRQSSPNMILIIG
jgi:hypothetical protein